MQNINRSLAQRKSVCTVGINNVNYVTGRCKFYSIWAAMIKRCYNSDGSMTGYSVVCNEWLKFSNFKSWMKEQTWENNYLDKDILVYGNKLYSPITCVFVSNKINTFIRKPKKNKYDMPEGVQYLPCSKTFRSYTVVNNANTKRCYNSVFKASEAHIRMKLNDISKFDCSKEVRLGLLKQLDELKKHNKRKCDEWALNND